MREKYINQNRWSWKIINYTHDDAFIRPGCQHQMVIIKDEIGDHQKGQDHLYRDEGMYLFNL